MQRRNSRSLATPSYPPTSTDVFEMFNEWKKWKMAVLDIFRPWENIPRDCLCHKQSLGMFSQGRKCQGRPPWRNHLKKSSGWSKSGFCIPTRTCSRLGCNFLANHGMDEEPYQFSKKPHKSHKSHPSHPLSHCHPALMGWYSAPLLQCKSSRYEAHCMPSARPYGTCWFMIAKIYGRRGILGITMAMILLVSSIRRQ